MSPPFPDHRLDGVTLFDAQAATINISYDDAKGLSWTISERRDTRKR